MSGSLRVPIALCRPAPFDALPISMSLLARAVKLLQPHLGGAKRETWLTLAFAEQRAIADAIDRTGAAADFTVRCVRYLLDRGCVGTRHALSLLLEVVSTGAVSEVQGNFRGLIDELDHRCAAPGARSPSSRPTTSSHDTRSPSGRRRSPTTRPAPAANCCRFGYANASQMGCCARSCMSISSAAKKIPRGSDCSRAFAANA